MSSTFVVINREFVPEADARLHVSDLAIQRGYGIFDFLKTVDGRPVFLDDHLDRFYRSASLMHLPVAQSRDELKALLREFVRRNGVADSGIRITLTGGDSKDGHTIGRPNLVIAQRPLPDNKAINERGIRLMTVAHQRQFPEAKTLDYLMSIWMQPTMREKGADDILYHQDGNISECPRSNIFIVTGDDRVVTPAKNILRGVIREKVLQMAREGLASEERDVSLDEVRRAKEVFMTSTTKNIIPVVAIDGAAVGTGRPGAVTLRIGKLLVARITEEVTNHPGRV